MHLAEMWNGDNSITDFDKLFAPDLLTPGQFFDRSRKFTNFEGERRMLRQILVDAIECWQSVSTIGAMDRNSVPGLRERLYREADFWIFGEYDNGPFFSFAETCDCLGLNPDFIRRRLLERRRLSAGR
jgi:hypothetical protein